MCQNIDTSHSDTYLTVGDEPAEGYYSELRSKFLGFVRHVTSVEQAMEVIKTLKAQYHDARHCCYAYMIGSDRKVFRFNDDGEPSSTAGKPIMGQIESRGLTDVVVCVVRYYGGVNLGTSRLALAYKAAAAAALDNSTVVQRTIEGTLEYNFAYPMMNAVMRVVKDSGAKIVSQTFDITCSIRLSIALSRVEMLRQRLEQLAFQ